jgi:hypothetical protein
LHRILILVADRVFFLRSLFFIFFSVHGVRRQFPIVSDRAITRLISVSAVVPRDPIASFKKKADPIALA